MSEKTCTCGKYERGEFETVRSEGIDGKPAGTAMGLQFVIVDGWVDVDNESGMVQGYCAECGDRLERDGTVTQMVSRKALEWLAERLATKENGCDECWADVPNPECCKEAAMAAAMAAAQDGGGDV